MRKRRGGVTEEPRRTKDEVVQQVERHVVEQQGADDLTRAEARPQECREGNPRSAGRRTGEEHNGNRNDLWEGVGDRNTRPGATDHAEVHLTFLPDAVQVHPKGERCSQPRADEWRGEPQCVGDAVEARVTVVDQIQVRADWRVSRGSKKYATHHQGKEHGEHRHQEQQRPRRAQTLLHSDTTTEDDHAIPAIARPTRSRSASIPDCSSVM